MGEFKAWKVNADLERIGEVLERLGFSRREFENPETYPLHEFCRDCKRGRKLFSDYCPGISAQEKFTLQACEAGKWVARQRWLKENA